MESSNFNWEKYETEHMAKWGEKGYFIDKDGNKRKCTRIESKYICYDISDEDWTAYLESLSLPTKELEKQYQ